MLFLFSLYELAFPTPEIDKLVYAHPGQIVVLVGARDGYSGGATYHRRNFFLLPSAIVDPKLFTIRTENGSVVERSEDKAGFVCGMAVVVLLIAIYFRSRWRKKE
jgi:hypothetical protein